MNKKIYRVFIICLVVICSLVIFAGCKPTNDITNTDDVTLKSLLIKTKPKQYYSQNESIDLSDGELLVVFSDDSSKTISFDDDEVEILHSGTGISDVTNTMRINYKDKSITMPYTVCGTKVITEVVLEGVPNDRYSIGSSLDFKNIKLIVKYKGAINEEIIWLTSGNVGGYNETYLEKENITVSGFDTSNKGYGNILIKYLSSEFIFNYEVVEESWITDVYIYNESVIKTQYFKDEPLKLNDAQMVVRMSDGTSKRIDIKSSMVSDFSTEVSGMYTMNIRHPDFEKTMSINYKVVLNNNITEIVPFMDYDDVNVDVGDSISFNNSILKVKIEDDDIIEIPIISSDVLLTCEGQPYKEVINTEYGRKFTINVEYKGHFASFEFIVVNYIISKEVINEDIDNPIKLVYNVGDEFDFGDAYMQFEWDDGQISQANLNEQFAIPVTIENGSKVTNRTVQFGRGSTNDDYEPDISEIYMDESGDYTIWILTSDKNNPRYEITYKVS